MDIALLALLERLKEAEFRKFKWYLQRADSLKGFSPIPVSALENADRQLTTDKMFQLYTTDTMTVAKIILENMGKVYILEPSGSSSKECQRRLKIELKKKFACVCEGIARPGNPAMLNQIYTELYIIQGGAAEVIKEHEVMQIEAASRTQARGEVSISRGNLFKTSLGRDKPVRTVVTKGVAGIGKTILTQKFTLDWAEDKDNQDIQLIFPFTFRELNVLNETPFSLVALVQHFFPEFREVFGGLEVFQESQVLFILDGLDECRPPLDFQNSKTLTDVTESASVDVLLTNLIRGKLLPSARLWITTRPAAAGQIPAECVDMVTVVRGFTDSQKDEYFAKRFEDKELARKIISHIKTSRSLHIMCHIPVFCWITSAVLEDKLKNRHGGELPKTLTELYIYFLVVQVKLMNIRHFKRPETHPHWNPETKRVIVSLARLAHKQLWEGKLFFYESDLDDSEIDVREASQYAGVFTQISKEEKGLYQEQVFSFVHLSVQEFMAALHVHLSFSGNDLEETKEYYQTTIEEALNSENGHLDLFLRFFLGLSLETNQSLLRGLMTHNESCSEINQETVQFIKEKISENQSPERIINLFHCLNELNDHSLVEEIQSLLTSGCLLSYQLSLTEWSALCFIILSSGDDLDVFDLKKYSASEEALERLLPVVKASKISLLNMCNLSARNCEALSSVLSSQSSRLRELDLSSNNLEDSGVDTLFKEPMSPHSCLEILRLRGCNLSQKSCAALSYVLSSQYSSLRELDLSYNSLGDTGVVYLSYGLMSEHCHLETLSLRHCGLSKGSCEALAVVFQLEFCGLKELDLSYNSLDTGMKQLSDGLKHRHCNLQTLKLCMCDLSSESCEDLSLVLSSQSSSLRELDLTDNSLYDNGVKLLCKGLRSPHCRLQSLNLSGCQILGESCDFLTSALSANPFHLRRLDLSYNPLEVQRVELLSAEQQGQHWTQDTLRLEPRGVQWKHCGVLKYFCELLPDMNSINRNLKVLQNKYVENVQQNQLYPDKPERFQHAPQLLCDGNLSGRCYWEVKRKGTIMIGVTYSRIKRNVKTSEGVLGYNSISWCLECSNKGYTFLHNGREVSIPTATISNRIAVYVDYPAGILSFYSISSDIQTHILSFNTKFTEHLYPGFVIYPRSSVSLGVPMEEEPSQNNCVLM